MRIGIDIGGTFTDVAAYLHGQLWFAKAPSTPDVVAGVLEGIGLVLETAGVDPASPGTRIQHLHGTTIATNALLEAKGACIGLLGTRGHHDALELGRMKRGHLYDLERGPETPVHLAPGRRRIGIDERIDGRGRVLRALDEDEVAHAVDALVDRHGVQALAICFLNAHANPSHERQAAAVVARRHPDLPISLSSSVNPVFREYERTCCTAFDAYVRPKVEHYVRQLASSLKEGEAGLQLMQSRGGLATAHMAVERPLSMFLSGPAAGVVAGAYVARHTGRTDAVTFDVGGTSTDVALVAAGRVPITHDGRIGRYPLRTPMVDLETVGSGGGSVAWIDPGGGLRVGPESAGAVPGPACYGRGGDRPTATDACLVLGYVDPERFAAGRMPLDPSLATAVIDDLAAQVGLDRLAAAAGIVRILVAQMAEAIKLVTIKRGVDPRRFALIAFGGGGAIYAPMVAAELGMAEVIVPRHPGTLSAFGLMVSDLEIDAVQTRFVRDARSAPLAELETIFQAMEAESAVAIRAVETADAQPLRRRSFDMRYRGQAYELEVRLTNAAPLDSPTMDAALIAFHDLHRAIYGHADETRQIEIVNLRSVIAEPAPALDPALLQCGLPTTAARPDRHRLAYFPDSGTIEVAAFRRDALALGQRLTGPVLIDGEDSTVVVPPGHAARVDATGNLFVTGKVE